MIRRRIVRQQFIAFCATSALFWASQLLLLLQLPPTTLAQEEGSPEPPTSSNGIPIDRFYDLAMDGTFTQQQLWWINIDVPDVPDELLFVVDDPNSPITALCDRDNAIPLIGYYRPGTVERWCLYRDGVVDSFMSRRYLRIATVSPAPTLAELVDEIDRLGPPATCVPPARRDILFEAMELLCFALGHKPAVIRQRQIHNPQPGGASSVTALVVSQDVPATLFNPHVRTLLRWLLKQPKVWRGVSRVQWDLREDQMGLTGMIDQPFEHSIILAHNAELGNHLVELRVQDASVPGQPSIEATAQYIAHVGAMLGYSRDEVQFYLETSGVVPPTDDPEERRAMFANAMREAFESCSDDDTGGGAEDAENEQTEMVCRHKQLTYPELDGFRTTFLQSEEAIVTPTIFYQLVEPVDELFLL